MSFINFFGGVVNSYNQREASKREAMARELEMEKAAQINLSNQKKIIELKEERTKETEKRQLAIKILTTKGYEVKSLTHVPIRDETGFQFMRDANNKIQYSQKTVTKTVSWTEGHKTWARNYLGPDFAGMEIATGSSNTSDTLGSNKKNIPKVPVNTDNNNNNINKPNPLGSGQGLPLTLDGTVRF